MEQATQIEFMNLAEAASLCDTCTTTVARWITRGCKVDGVYYKLRAVRYPGGWRVSRPAVAEFLGRLTEASRGELDPSGSPDPSGTQDDGG
jgi:hypothetical protein